MQVSSVKLQAASKNPRPQKRAPTEPFLRYRFHLKLAA
ncbi:hypothetical protein [Pseudomonas fluorescens]|nr:hypothetical protein [Pseudomonas fluorescens]